LTRIVQGAWHLSHRSAVKAARSSGGAQATGFASAAVSIAVGVQTTLQLAGAG
jgi:hypothetical protein